MANRYKASVATRGYFYLSKKKQAELIILGQLLRDNRGSKTQKEYSKELGCGVSVLQRAERGIYFGRLYSEILKGSGLPVPNWIK